MVATLVYLIYDPATRTATYCTAGHPPPLLQETTGETRFIGTERNIPLGVIGGFEYGAETIEIPLGGRVLLYTDGLIEDPASSIEAGLDRLRLAAESGPEELEAFADHVLDQIFSRIDRTDDVALLAIRPLH
jgi:serine phosphatase RsbU (regulator of sigma subunit)